MSIYIYIIFRENLANDYTEMGYSSEMPQPSLTERQHQGAQVEKTLKGEKDAARAPAN